MSKYEPVIGLEIHAELKTSSKMFCSCKNDPFNSKQNENICPVCLGMPGTLPVLNKKAIEWTILTGLALGANISSYTKWDRKNYYYPDLPKGYQISQYDLPIVNGGYIEVIIDTENSMEKSIQLNQKKKINITRIHLEEDTGTLKHPEGKADIDYSLADYNRAGVPLMELVTEPDIRSGEEAKKFCQKYQQMLRYLGVSNAEMEKGQMRCEANISVRKVGDKKFGTKVEVKNLNSFKAVERAIKYEIERQIDVIETGEKVVQETRGWDDAKGKTYRMRVKETSADYRYFPEPDLPPITIKSTEIEKLKKELPLLPDEISKIYLEKYSLNINDVENIVNDIEKVRYFEKCIKFANHNQKYISKAAGWILNEIPDLSVEPATLLEIIELIEQGDISGKIAKEILPDVKKGKKPSDIIKEKGIGQISDTNELESVVDKVINNNQDAVNKIKDGQKGVMGFLVGQIMKETKGQANPKVVNELLNKKLK